MKTSKQILGAKRAVRPKARLAGGLSGDPRVRLPVPSVKKPAAFEGRAKR